MNARPIKPIRSDADYDAALAEIESLFASRPDSEEADRLEVLAVLAQDYQRTHHPIGPPSIQSAIEFELDRRGLMRQDFDPVNDIEIVGTVNAGRTTERMLKTA